jgi:hypothetical protein
MVPYDMQRDDNSIFKNNQDRQEDTLPLKECVICKMQPPSYLSCKTDILWVVPFLQNRGNTTLVQQMYFLHAMSPFTLNH